MVAQLVRAVASAADSEGVELSLPLRPSVGALRDLLASFERELLGGGEGEGEGGGGGGGWGGEGEGRSSTGEGEGGPNGPTGAVFEAGVCEGLAAFARHAPAG